MSRLMRNRSGNGEIRLEMIISKIKEEREIEREEKTDTSHRVKKGVRILASQTFPFYVY